jgi:plastocyanin
MFRSLTAASLVLLGFAAAGCGGYDGSPTSPDAPPAPPPGAIVIDIVGNSGARSFNPNPATVPAGQTVVWHNVDSITHRVELDDRGLDTGNIAPGAFSAAMMLPAAGPYHCSLHPPMVGRVVR